MGLRMKKILSYLRSMRFGILLLVLIALLSVAGSVIPQERELAWYVENYPGAHPTIFFLQLYRVFQSWYFLLLLGLLCVNLTLCSLLRGRSLLGSRERLLSACAGMKNSVPLSGEGLIRLEQHLKSKGCRSAEFGRTRVYYKHLPGAWGSFVTHLSILLTVIVGAMALTLPQVTDMDCLPGESVTLKDPNGGTARFTVSDFRTNDAGGRLDFASRLTVTLPDGRSRLGEISVNHPLSFGPYKVYQQSYGTAGSVTVTNLQNQGSDSFALTDLSFLSMDNQSGVWFVALYPDYLINANGEILPVNTGDPAYPHPVYHVQTVNGEEREDRLLFPGDTVEIGALRFRFDEPLRYPGLRIKVTPSWIEPLLIACFALMIAGLYLLFFLPPVLVRLDDEGYAVCGPKPEGMRLELMDLLNMDKGEAHS